MIVRLSLCSRGRLATRRGCSAAFARTSAGMCSSTIAECRRSSVRKWLGGWMAITLRVCMIVQSYRCKLPKGSSALEQRNIHNLFSYLTWIFYFHRLFILSKKKRKVDVVKCYLKNGAYSTVSEGEVATSRNIMAALFFPTTPFFFFFLSTPSIVWHLMKRFFVK